jgi:hypothetical protein
MTNKERLEQLEKTVATLLQLVDLQKEQTPYVLAALENLDERERLNQKRLKYLEKDVLNLQRQDSNINDNWRPL